MSVKSELAEPVKQFMQMLPLKNNDAFIKIFDHLVCPIEIQVTPVVYGVETRMPQRILTSFMRGS